MAINVEHSMGDEKSITDALSVRAAVFQVEQGIPATDDYDGRDDEADQFVAYEDGKPIGTARYRKLPDGVIKVERVATMPEYRGSGVGSLIMSKISEVAKEQGQNKVTLDSQEGAADFYEKLGYRVEGEPFDEVGIPHVVMTLDLDGPE